ncbi:MAG TPA: hypothetical protein VLJ61_09705 [Pyrinomonadaceae bacterium]|nr:hypothetical protein [Pyrinomonadaceae bacterium]
MNNLAYSSQNVATVRAKVEEKARDGESGTAIDAGDLFDIEGINEAAL